MISEHEFWLKELERVKAIGTQEEIKEVERQLKKIYKEWREV